MKTSLAVLLLGLISVSTASASDVYACKMQSFSRGGWVAPNLIIVVDEQAGVATAFDGAIALVHDKPIPIEIVEANESRYRFQWNLENLPMRGALSGHITYIVSVNRKSNRARVDGTVHGYANQIRGQGSCMVIKR